MSAQHNYRNFKKDELLDLLDQGETVHRGYWRHGTRDCIVFPADGAFWMVWLDNHHEEGIEIWDAEVRAQEVERVQHLTDVWEPVVAGGSNEPNKEQG